MIHCFSNFAIDEARGELRSGDRVDVPQRRVFGLLAHLARHPERIVSKQELLDAVWPGLIVTDNSVQRAVSVARAALRRLGCEGGIRTYARRGYRLCVTKAGAGDEDRTRARDAARAAFSRGEWDTALAVFPRLDPSAFAPEDFQFWAHIAQCAGRPLDVLPLLERVAARSDGETDRTRAAWAAMMVAQLRVDWREPALAKGWLQRAARLLGTDRKGREFGYLSFLQCRLALLQNDLAAAIILADRARDVGRACEDRDLEAFFCLDFMIWSFIAIALNQSIPLGFPLFYSVPLKPLLMEVFLRCRNGR
jgi:DNA-binding winged helix-turn-helix (wHTH) protein